MRVYVFSPASPEEQTKRTTQALNFFSGHNFEIFLDPRPPSTAEFQAAAQHDPKGYVLRGYLGHKLRDHNVDLLVFNTHGSKTQINGGFQPVDVARALVALARFGRQLRVLFAQCFGKQFGSAVAEFLEKIIHPWPMKNRVLLYGLADDVTYSKETPGELLAWVKVGLSDFVSMAEASNWSAVEKQYRLF